MVSILTALYFRWLRAGDLVAIKPQPSPAYHALRYLLGNLDASYLTRCASSAASSRIRRGPRTPTGSTSRPARSGLGAVAPMFAASPIVPAPHFGERGGRWPDRRFVALVGDAELDEGTSGRRASRTRCSGLGNVTMIVDLNRQSLDRVVPGIRVRQLEGMFAAAGWQVVEAKYGRRLQAVFALPGGETLRRRIDEMANEEYQVLIRQPGAEHRARLLERRRPGDRDGLAAVLATAPDDELPRRSPTSAATTSSSWCGPWTRPTPTGPGRGDLRLHGQGLAAAVRRRSPEPFRACSADQIERSPRPGGRRGRPLGGVRPPVAGGPAAGATRRGAAATTRRRGRVGTAQMEVPHEVDVRIAPQDITQQVLGDALAALARVQGVGDGS